MEQLVAHGKAYPFQYKGEDYEFIINTHGFSYMNLKIYQVIETKFLWWKSKKLNYIIDTEKLHLFVKEKKVFYPINEVKDLLNKCMLMAEELGKCESSESFSLGEISNDKRQIRDNKIKKILE